MSNQTNQPRPQGPGDWHVTFTDEHGATKQGIAIVFQRGKMLLFSMIHEGRAYFLNCPVDHEVTWVSPVPSSAEIQGMQGVCAYAFMWGECESPKKCQLSERLMFEALGNLMDISSNEWLEIMCDGIESKFVAVPKQEHRAMEAVAQAARSVIDTGTTDNPIDAETPKYTVSWNNLEKALAALDSASKEKR